MVTWAVVTLSRTDRPLRKVDWAESIKALIFIVSASKDFGYDFEYTIYKTYRTNISYSSISCHLWHQCNEGSVNTGEVEVAIIEGLKNINEILT